MNISVCTFYPDNIKEKACRSSYTFTKGLTLHGTRDSVPHFHLTNFALFTKIVLECTDAPCGTTSIYINDFVASNIDIIAHCYLGSPCYTEISNSIFNEVSIVFSNAITLLSNTMFHNGTSTPLTFYFSRISMVGDISFVTVTTLE